MIKFFTTLLSVEVATSAILLFENPLQRIVMAIIDKLKHGKFVIVAKTIICILLGFLAFNLYFVMKFWDQDTASIHHLQASYIGYSLFLILVIERLQSHITRRMDLENINEDMTNRYAQCETDNVTLKEQNEELQERYMSMRRYCEAKYGTEYEELKRKARANEAKEAFMSIIKDREQKVAASLKLVSLARRRRPYRPWYYH